MEGGIWYLLHLHYSTGYRWLRKQKERNSGGIWIWKATSSQWVFMLFCCYLTDFHIYYWKNNTSCWKLPWTSERTLTKQLFISKPTPLCNIAKLRASSLLARCVCACFVSFRSRLADFQHNCQPSALSASGCVRESRAMCLKAYAGLIGEMEEQEVVAVCRFICVLYADNGNRQTMHGFPPPVSCKYHQYNITMALFCHSGTIMTPNYVSNSSTEVSQWCTCDGSGNEWQGCQRILNMFSNNMCLREWNVPYFRVQLQRSHILYMYIIYMYAYAP